ncbi:MAG: phosphate acyltransferase PlsX [bacterium]
MASTSQSPVIAVDAMGGDHGPAVVVPGAVQALAQRNDFSLALYGDESAIVEQLQQLDVADQPISIIHCIQDIDMAESPAAAIRGKPDSPIVRALKDQKAGSCDALVSAGSTGAMVAASLVILGRLSSVDRPAIGTLIPAVDDHFLLLDVGANVQCNAEHLRCFAEMGNLYCREILGRDEPRIGLLNIGEEETKGSELVIKTYQLLQQTALNFIGNVESNRLLLGTADVVVTDGFTGNMALKLIEGFGHFLGEIAGSAQLTDADRKLLVPGLAVLDKKLDYAAYGGAMLLGIDGISIISHGRSSSRAITNAVLVARRQAVLDIPRKLQQTLARRA